MGRFLEGALKPGSREFVILLNLVLGLLFLVMLTVVYTELENSMHVFVLLFIIVGLTLSINWFIVEANRLKEMQVAESTTGASNTKQTTRAKTD
ncbi:hypothetical protein Poli38472_012734 [Pythium oligandrum]|uniref:Uncharacterized protein n=1 Tax=Pythium oligandrum TaxID=41045 RepID=A0A8K1FKA5_PYTOL|nr:hypothetical protein Poli38472_012734 [Pythium oligandrum]|eukprot:TMW61543.1 hypothetical protein Poli38472_012734 [Pythium oligandrum]